jgi:hypothetical protein
MSADTAAASCNRLAEMADLTLDAYRILAKAIGQVLSTADTEQRTILMRTFEEATVILNYANSPSDGGT